VDGSFTDDVTGLPAEHGAAPGNMRLSAAEVTAIQAATQDTNGELIAQAVAMGKYIWAAFGDQDGVSAGPSSSNCAAWMRQRCNADWQTRATTQNLDTGNVNQSIAAFLVVRPPMQVPQTQPFPYPPTSYPLINPRQTFRANYRGFIGHGWESDQRSWRSEYLWQVGEPTPAGAVCSESPAGVFSRPWTAGTVSLDCNTWTATIPTM
jgi:hypothetical protein